MWIAAIAQGILLGLGLAFAIGPVFFALIDLSLSRGFREGAKMALGINLSDVAFALLCWLGVGGIFTGTESHGWLAIGGGIVLIVFGLSSILRKPSPKTFTPPDRKSYRSRFGSVGKGILLNTLNPGTPVIWLAASSVGANFVKNGGLPLQMVFLGSILVTVLLTDVTKAYVARRLRDLLTTGGLLWLNRIAGLIMVVAGIIIMFDLKQRLGLGG